MLLITTTRRKGQELIGFVFTLDISDLDFRLMFQSSVKRGIVSSRMLTIWKVLFFRISVDFSYFEINVFHFRHLNGCVLDGLTRPHLLITDAFNANYTQARRRLRDEQLMSKLCWPIIFVYSEYCYSIRCFLEDLFHSGDLGVYNWLTSSSHRCNRWLKGINIRYIFVPIYQYMCLAHS